MLNGKLLKHRYQIYDTLGHGGSSTLFIGRDLPSGRMVTIKLVNRAHIDESRSRLLLNEMRILQQLNSRHIVPIYDYAVNYQQADLPVPITFLVLKYIEGLSLEEVLAREKTLSVINTLALGRQVVLALAELHARGVVHRDLKTANIMIGVDNQVQLVDFGISKRLESNTLSPISGQFMGNLQTASPEQMRDARSVDIRSDLYSLGVVLAQCLTGKTPTRNLHGQHVLAMEELNARNGEAHATDAFALIARLLSLAPEDRFLQPATLLERLDMLLQQTELLLPWGHLTAVALPTAPANETLSLESFSQPRYWLVTSNGKNLPLNQPEVRIGRGSAADESWHPEIDVDALQLDHAATVSRLHCVLFTDLQGHYHISDLGSFNGTYINDEKLENGSVRPLRLGDLIELGGVQLSFRGDASPM
ncbi:MAG TPA: FHA domain-containing serine/threonine-protein kinase [Anaerolineales bacterium]|nr:FHA domain-containing serine/threonine-protein kinase [Anaerolineales bacterium]